MGWVNSQFNDLLSSGLSISLDLGFLILKMGMIMEPKSEAAVMIKQNNSNQTLGWSTQRMLCID